MNDEEMVTLAVSGDITVTKQDIEDAGGSLMQAAQNALGHAGMVVAEVFEP